MSQETITTTLTPEEWRIILAVREIPHSPLRSKVAKVMDDLIFYIRNPRCEGMQADGFPCGDPRNNCEECHRIWELLDRLGEQVPKEA
ncbi:MAG: hypothetical protein HY823_00950 [Acidobacteria bacterium]|nr:hypothetical protein [Acidobacteriota bacterium]